MKTIEELADEYVGHPEEIDEFSSATIKRQAFIAGANARREIDIEEKRITARKFYLTGAKDQKKIDIEKACEWLKANVNDYIVEVGKDWHSDNIVGSDFIEDFRKAMEEGL